MRATTFLAGLLACACAAAALAAPVPPGVKTGVVKDRKDFIPHRKYSPLGGKVVAVLVSDVAPMMGQEGRGGPPDAMGLSVNGGSYRWVYVPVNDRPLITNLRVPVGEKGERFKVYPSLSMASPTTVRQLWGITMPYALVEAEVNDGEGSPAGESFTATRMTRLDGTKAYPLDLTRTVADLKKRYAASLKDRQKAVDAEMDATRTRVLNGRAVTGPRTTEELFYITWMPETKRVRVHFRTKVNDGAWKQAFVGGPGPFALPAPLPPGVKAPVRRPPPPPPFRRPFPVRYGVGFGVEYGTAYEVDRFGKVVTVLELPPQGFSNEVPMPPGGRLPPGGPVPLPPVKLPVDK